MGKEQRLAQEIIRCIGGKENIQQLSYISRSGVYLFYIVISFILYPFAKVLFDWLFGFKVRHALDKQKGITYYFDQLMFMFDYIVFHVSLFIAPIGMLFLLIRFIVNRVKS